MMDVFFFVQICSQTWMPSFHTAGSPWVTFNFIDLLWSNTCNLFQSCSFFSWCPFRSCLSPTRFTLRSPFYNRKLANTMWLSLCWGCCGKHVAVACMCNAVRREGIVCLHSGVRWKQPTLLERMRRHTMHFGNLRAVFYQHCMWFRKFYVDGLVVSF